MFNSLGKFFILLGVIFLIVGLLLTIFPKLGFFGKLPGDIVIKKENFHFYFPITTSILISIVLTLIFLIISFLFKK